MTAINPQAVRGPVTAVPVVAGKGVRFVEDVPNNRVVAEVDETVLWENTSDAMTKDLTFPLTLSESINNFEKVEIWYAADSGSFSSPIIFTFPVRSDGDYCMSAERYDGTAIRYFRATKFHINGTSVTNPYNLTQNWSGNTVTGSNSTAWNKIYKIVGINRIASA